METIGSLLIVVGMMAFLGSLISVVWPLKGFGLTTRKRSALALLLSFVVLGIGAALAPDRLDQPSAQDVDQAEPEPTPQPAVPADPSPPVETTEAPQESPETTEPEQQSVSRSAGARRIDGENKFGCRSRDYFSKLGRYAAQNDREAWSRALEEGALSGECILFEADEPVFVTDTALFSGLVKVRRKGKLTEFWTDFETVTN